MPEQGLIYFAVDYDAPAGDMPAIEAYFRAARAETENYEVGVYGPYRVIEYLARRRVCRGYWQCVGWSGGQLSAYRNVYQAQWGKVVAGIPVDIDDCPDMARAGLWDYALEEVSEVRYNQLSEVPDWAKGTVETLVDRGFLAGSGGGCRGSSGGFGSIDGYAPVVGHYGPGRSLFGELVRNHTEKMRDGPKSYWKKNCQSEIGLDRERNCRGRDAHGSFMETRLTPRWIIGSISGPDRVGPTVHRSVSTGRNCTG